MAVVVNGGVVGDGVIVIVRAVRVGIGIGTAGGFGRCSAIRIAGGLASGDSLASLRSRAGKLLVVNKFVIAAGWISRTFAGFLNKIAEPFRILDTRKCRLQLCVVFIGEWLSWQRACATGETTDESIRTIDSAFDKRT